MRAVLMTVLVLAGTPAMACNDQFIEIENWEVTAIWSGIGVGANVAIDYRLKGDRGYRLIDARIHFEDALGMDLNSVVIPRDVPVAAGETVKHRQRYKDARLMMISRLQPDDVKVTSCVRAVVYDDGTKEEF